MAGGERITFACGCWYVVDEYGDVDDAERCVTHKARFPHRLDKEK